jgi:hypothetical protein
MLRASMILASSWIIYIIHELWLHIASDESDSQAYLSLCAVLVEHAP